MADLWNSGPLEYSVLGRCLEAASIGCSSDRV